MRTREWSLVAFTLLIQSSIGTLLIVVAVSLAAADGAVFPSHAFDMSLAVGALAGGLALLVSLLHLGDRAQAWLTLANVRTSWLSREVLASLLFVASAAAIALQRLGGGGVPAMWAVAVVLGLAVIYAMSRVYMVPAQPAWNRLVTPLTFFTSALLLGIVLVIGTSTIEPFLLRRLVFAAVALLIVQSAITPLFVAGLPAEPAVAVSAASIGSTAVWLTAARIGAAIVAVVLLLLAPASGAPASIAVSVLAFTFVLVSELVGRVLFYSGSASIHPF